MRLTAAEIEYERVLKALDHRMDVLGEVRLHDLFLEAGGTLQKCQKAIRLIMKGLVEQRKAVKVKGGRWIIVKSNRYKPMKKLITELLEVVKSKEKAGDFSELAAADMARLSGRLNICKNRLKVALVKDTSTSLLGELVSASAGSKEVKHD